MRSIRTVILSVILFAVYTSNLLADDLAVAKSLSAAFAKISKTVAPSVVTITTERTIKRKFHFKNKTPFDQFFPFYWSPFFDYPGHDQVLHSTVLGSGVIISEDGYIVTNNHVVEQSDDINVKLYDKREFKAKLIGTDPKTDVALIKIEADGLRPIKLGDSDKLQVGEWVLAIGSPFSGNLSNTITQGIVSAKGRSSVGLLDYEDFIQTDAAINPGNSGGALVNLDGELVGINTAIASRSGGYQGIGFAIPVNLVKRIIADLKSSGRVTRAWLGVLIQEIDPSMAKTLGLDRAEGALVGKVVEDSPAEKAGFKVGDVIIRFGSWGIKDAHQLRMLVSSRRPGEKFKVKVIRDGEEKTLKVKLAELPEEYAAASAPESVGNDLGLTVKTITPQLAQEYGYDEDTEGVIITEVEFGSPAFQKGIQPGTIIQKIGPDVKHLRPIKNLADYRKALRKAEPGESILFLMKKDDNTFFVVLEIPEK